MCLLAVLHINHYPESLQLQAKSNYGCSGLMAVSSPPICLGDDSSSQGLDSCPVTQPVTQPGPYMPAGPRGTSGWTQGGGVSADSKECSLRSILGLNSPLFMFLFTNHLARTNESIILMVFISFFSPLMMMSSGISRVFYYFHFCTHASTICPPSTRSVIPSGSESVKPSGPASTSVSTFYVNSSVCARAPCWDPRRRERSLNGLGGAVMVGWGGVAFTDLCALSEEVRVTVFCISAEESGAVNAALDANA